MSNEPKTASTTFNEDEVNDEIHNSIPQTKAFKRLRDRPTAFTADHHCAACGNEIKKLSNATRLSYMGGSLLFGAKCWRHVALAVTG